MKRRTAILTLTLPLMAGGFAWGEQPVAKGTADSVKTETRQAGDQQVMTKRVSHIIGKDVHNHDGKKIGDIKDVVLDGNTNRISYAVVGYGGVLGIGDKLFAVPWSSLQHRSIEPDKLVLNVNEDSLKNAPGFDKNNWPNMADQNFRQSVDKYYNDNRSLRNNGGNNGANNADQALDNAGQKMENAGERIRDKAQDFAQGADRTVNNDPAVKVDRNVNAADDLKKDGLLWTRRASQVIGADVHNQQNENLGDIEDLVIDANTGRVNYAVLSFGGVLGIGDKLFAIPMNSLQTKADDKEFVLNVPKDQLKNAPGFSKNAWPDFASAQFRNSVDQYYGGNRSTEAKTD